MLLAEDVEINREIVITLLEPTGLKIDCAENGREAFDMFCSAPDKYQLIFMDVQMPEMDGYEATKKIRAFEAERLKDLPPVPIIAMTANVFREDVEKCLASGMNDHVGKPLDINEVLDKLRRSLKK
jgi:CheY-like chemotaxis protein